MKKVFFWILILIAALFLAGLWYTKTFSMKKVEAFEVYSPDFNKKLLIATQGSDFKNGVTSGIVENYEHDSIYIKVIDVFDLDRIDPKDFDALLIIHTWENWKPPRTVLSFTNKNREFLQKIVYLTTSGEGSYALGDVDAITGESIVDDVPIFVDLIIDKLKPLLDK